MKKGKENKKLNKFLAANLSVIMCLSSVPSTYTIVAVEEDEESTFSIEVQDLFRTPVEEAVVDFKIYSSSEEEPVYETQVTTNSNGLAQFSKAEITESLQNHAAPEEGENPEATEETYTFCYSAEKEGYYSDSARQSTDEFEASRRKLYVAEKADISGTVDFIGANLSLIDPLYSMRYSIDGIYEDAGPDPVGISRYLNDEDLEKLIETDANGIDFTLREMPLAPEFSITVIPDQGFTVDVEQGQGSFSTYRETTKKVELKSKEELGSVGIKVDPAATMISFPTDTKNGTFSVNGEPVTGNLYLEDEEDHLDFSFIPNADVELESFFVSVEGQAWNDLLKYQSDNNYTLRIPEPGLKIDLSTSVVDVNGPQGSVELVNEDQFVQSQQIRVSVTDGYSETVWIKLIKLDKDSDTEEEMQVGYIFSGDDYVFDISDNGTYKVRAIDEKNNWTDLPLKGKGDSEETGQVLIDIQNIDTTAPVQKGETISKFNKESGTYTVEFDLTDPVSDADQGAKPSGIEEVYYELQTGNSERVTLKAETKEDENTEEILSHFEFEIAKDDYPKCVVYVSDKVGNTFKFSPSNKPYLDITVENEDIWTSKKNIHIAVRKPVQLKNSDEEASEKETEEAGTEADGKYSVEILGSNGKPLVDTQNLTTDEGNVIFDKPVSEKDGIDCFVKVTEINPEDPENPMELIQKIKISKVDVTAATISFISSGFNNRSFVSSVPLTYKVTDKESGVKEFRISRKLATDDDSSYSELGVIPAHKVYVGDKDGSGRYQITYPTEFEQYAKIPVSGKKYTYKVEAVNNANIRSDEQTNYSNYTTTNIAYDFDKPVISNIKLDQNKRWFFSKDVTLTFDVKDPAFEDGSKGSGINWEEVQVRLVPENGKAGDWQKTDRTITGGCSFVIKESFKGYIHIKAVDFAGNETVVIVNGVDGPAIDIIDADTVQPEISLNLKDSYGNPVAVDLDENGNFNTKDYYFSNEFSITAKASLDDSKLSSVKSVKIDLVNPDDPKEVIRSVSSSKTNKKAEFTIGIGEINGYLSKFSKTKTREGTELKFVITATTKHGNSVVKELTTRFDNIAPSVSIGEKVNELRKSVNEEIKVDPYLVENSLDIDSGIFKLTDQQSSISKYEIHYDGHLYFVTNNGIQSIQLDDKHSLDQAVSLNTVNSEREVTVTSIDPFDTLTKETEEENYSDLRKHLKNEGDVGGKYAFVGDITLIAYDAAGNFDTYENSKDDKPNVLRNVVIDQIQEIDLKVTAKSGKNDYLKDDPDWTNEKVVFEVSANNSISGIENIKVSRKEKDGEEWEDIRDVKFSYKSNNPENMMDYVSTATLTIENEDDFDGEYRFEAYGFASSPENPKKQDVRILQDLTKPEVERIDLNGNNILNSAEDERFSVFENEVQKLSFKTNWNISGWRTEQYLLTDKLEISEDKPDWTDLSKPEESIELEPNTRFFVHYLTTDNAQNETLVHSKGVILDNQKPVGVKNTNGIDINLPAANENGFYNGSVDVGIDIVDPAYSGTERNENDGVYSGLSEVSYRIYATDTGAEDSKTVFDAENGPVDGFTGAPGKDANYLTKTLSGTIRIDAEQFNSNNVILEVTAVDNAGNTTVTSTKLGDIKIDITKPVISVSYDNNDPKNDHYYKADRTATITVTERNFNPDDVKLTITNTDGTIPVLSEWSVSEADGNGDATTHTATVSYTADGDYTFDIEYTDLADNKAEGINFASGTTNPSEFTIDKTKPVIDVKYNLNNSNNYYNETRIATIEVNEHNFDPNAVTIEIAANIGKVGSDEKSSVIDPVVKSAWTTDSGSDVHRMTIEYAKDADYVFKIDMTDLADNANDPFSEQTFTVDKVFENFNVLVKFGDGTSSVDDNIHTNDGDQTNPTHGYSYQEIKNGISVQFSDINLDKDATTSKLEWTHRDTHKDETGATDSLSNRDKEGSLDFSIDPTTRTTDGIYTLSSTVKDLAGNQKSADLKFSISKYGSFYMYEQNLADLQQKGSLQYVQGVDNDLVITEYNPSGVQDNNLSVVISRDSNALTKDEIAEGVKTGELLDPDHADNQSGWYKRGYTIHKSNFDKEGLYGISVSSTDDAGTVSQNDAAEDNVLNGDLEPKIQFYVDKNAPVLDYVDGIDGESFNAEQREVNYSVSDTIGLAKVEVYITNTETGDKVKADEVDITRLENDKKYAGTITIHESNDKQKLSFVITDKSGRTFNTDNETEEDLAGIYTPTFLMTSNPWVLFTNNKPLFYGSLAGLVAIIGGFIAFLLFKNRKQEEEEEQDSAAI